MNQAILGAQRTSVEGKGAGVESGLDATWMAPIDVACAIGARAGKRPRHWLLAVAAISDAAGLPEWCVTREYQKQDG